MTLVPSSDKRHPWKSSASRGSRYWPTTSLRATHTISLHIPHLTPLPFPLPLPHPPTPHPTPHILPVLALRLPLFIWSQSSLSARLRISEYQVRGLWWYPAMVYSHHLQIHLFIIPKSILRALWWSFMDICRGMKILHFWYPHSQLIRTLCLLVSALIL